MPSEKPTDTFEVFLNVIITVAVLVSLWLFTMLIMLFVSGSDSIEEEYGNTNPTQLESLSQQSMEQQGIEQVMNPAKTVDSRKKLELNTFQKIQSNITHQNNQIPNKKTTNQHKININTNSTETSSSQKNKEYEELVIASKELATASKIKSTINTTAIKKYDKKIQEVQVKSEVASRFLSMSELLSNLPFVVFDCEMPTDEVNSIAKLVVDTATTNSMNNRIYKNDDKSASKLSDNIELEMKFHYAYGGNQTQIQALMPVEKVAYALPTNAYVLLLQDSIYYYRFVQLDEPTLNIAGMMSIYTKKSHHLINHYNCSSSSALNLPQLIEQHSLSELDAVQSQKILSF